MSSRRAEGVDHRRELPGSAEDPALHEALRVFSAPERAPDLVAAVMARVEADRGREAAPSWAPRLAWVGVAAAVVAGLGISQRAPRHQDRGEVIPGAAVDLLVVVERGEDGASLERRDGEVAMTREDGLVFWFSTSVGGELTLVERDPEHRLRVLHHQRLLGPEQMPFPLRAAGGGPVLRYAPDGPPGAYYYLAVVGPHPVRDEPAALEEVWQTWARQQRDVLEVRPDGIDVLTVHLEGEGP